MIVCLSLVLSLYVCATHTYNNLDEQSLVVVGKNAAVTPTNYNYYNKEKRNMV